MKIGIAGRLAKAFIDSKLTPLLIVTALLIGVLATYLTPREEEPQIVVPMVDIFVPFAGSSAKEVEELVTYTLEDVATCFPGITPFAIHARTSYVVRSSFASYLHRVVSDGGSCRVDAARPVDPADPQTRVEGRAFVGRPYVNPYLAFHISDRRADGSTVGSMEGLRSVFTVTTRLLPAVAVIDIGRIVSDVLLTPNRENLIVIDSAASSLGQYALDPLVRQASVQ